jgi:hypothetical protein
MFDITIEDARRKGARIPPPASVEDLRQCQRDLKAKKLPFIPQRYFAFLKNVCNGFAYGSVTFYGTKTFFHSWDHPGDSTEDLVTANEQSGDIKYHLFLLGHGWDTKYFYNMKNGLFETREYLGYGLLSEYKSFKDMFDYETIRG